MSAVQLAYGLQIEVDVPLPGFIFQPEPRHKSDLYVRLKSGPSFLSALFRSPNEFYCSNSNFDEQGGSNLRVLSLSGGQYYGFVYSDGVRFAVDRAGREIWGDRPDGYAFEDACTYLVGPVIAFALRLQGVTCLHASAIAAEKQAFVLMGPAGAGKSTTAAGFAKLGFSILTDDVVALSPDRNRLLVQPGYPRLNLWPDAVRELFGSEEALPPITPTWDKRYLNLDRSGNCHFQAEPLPLSGVFVLRERDAALNEPVIEQVAGTNALMLLVANAYGNHFLNEEMQRRDLQTLSRLASRVPVRQVRTPDEPSKVYALCEAIAADARRIAQTKVRQAGYSAGYTSQGQSRRRV